MDNSEKLKTSIKKPDLNNLDYYELLLYHIDIMFNIASNTYLFENFLKIIPVLEMIYNKIVGATLYARLCGLITQEQYNFIYSKAIKILYYN